MRACHDFTFLMQSKNRFGMKHFQVILSLWCGIFAITCSAPASEQPLVGNSAPDFELPDQIGQLQSLEDYRGQWVVLYFYPKDQTPGCTLEACQFRDNIFAFRKANAQILGISFDDVESHSEFAAEYDLPFPLLADVDGKAADAYGVTMRKLGLKLARRETFLIDPEGVIVKHYTDVNPETHSAAVLADLASLESSREVSAAL